MKDGRGGEALENLRLRIKKRFWMEVSNVCEEKGKA